MRAMTNPAATDEDKQDLYWAVVDHERTWLRDDAPFIHEIEKMNGALEGHTLRRIAIRYNVSRCILARTQDGDTHADALAQLINGTSWPSALVPRAEVCAELAHQACEQRHTHGILASAITKFSWFAQPLGWTVYDRFVRSAMGIRGSHPVDCMVRFYRELEQRDFLNLAEKIQALLDKHSIKLYGTRVLDKLMMLNGADKLRMRKGMSANPDDNWAGKIRSDCREFLRVLPPDRRQVVESVAQEVAERIDLGRFLNAK
jgi:hypothetical protein